MAKHKGEPKQLPGKYSEDDIAEFVAALETDGDAPVASAESGVPGRRILVREETEPKHRRSSLSEGEADLSRVLERQPSEEMQHLTKSKRGFPWGWVIGIIALLAVVSVAGFFFFNRAKRFTNDNVQLQFQPVTSAISGSNLTVTVEYQNLEPVDLTNAELTVEYPAGFTYTTSQPAAANEFRNAFTLGTIRSGQAGRTTISGTIIGAVGEARDFGATLTYRPANFNSDFQTKASRQVTITASILSLQFTGPTQLAPGGTGTWTATYANTSDRDLKNVQITAAYPDGFTVTSTNPAAQERSAVWKFPELKKGVQGSITVVGSIDGNLGDSFPLKVSAGLVTATNTVDLQDEQSLLVILVKTGVTTTVAVNGSTDPAVIDPGETLNYSIRVTNASDLEITQATVTVKLDGAALDLSKLANDSQAAVKSNVLTWTKDQVAALANLKPNQSVTLSFAVGTLPNLAVKTDADRDPKVTASIDVTAPSLTTNANRGGQPSTVVVIKLATVLQLAAAARYYEAPGQAVGSGPVPPVVGKTTTYRVTWTVTDSTSDAATLVVSARIPTSVLWTGQNLSRDAGDLTFDPTSRTVRWTLNTVPAGTGGRLPALTARFDLAITPTAEQVGTVPILIETATATATDSFTAKALSSPAATLTTDLPSDPTVSGQGVVIAAP
ncbi:MAG: hypothetical protein AAB619_03345 [Patescibacteria group bacterium]